MKRLFVLIGIIAILGLGAFLLATQRDKPSLQSSPVAKQGETTSAEGEWLTDYKTAQDQARSSHKLLLLQFTGSDWCPPCRMMQKQVFDTPEFQDYARKNFVLMEIDFPRRKTLTPEITQQNQSLAQIYEVTVFPTVIITDATGKKIGEMHGYDPRAGLSGVIAQLDRIRKS